jgi:hypothetical protein
MFLDNSVLIAGLGLFAKHAHDLPEIQFPYQHRCPVSHWYSFLRWQSDGIDTGMRQEKDSNVDFYRGQPTNKPNAIAKAMAALAADETKNGTIHSNLILMTGNAVVCVGDRYYESEETYWKILPQMVSSEVTENWAKVLTVNPFKHMAD